MKYILIFTYLFILIVVIIYYCAKNKKKIEQFNDYSNNDIILRDLKSMLIDYKKYKYHEFQEILYNDAIKKPKLYNLNILKSTEDIFDIRIEIDNRSMEEIILKKIVIKESEKIKFNNLKVEAIKSSNYSFWDNTTGNSININLLDRYIFLIIRNINYIIDKEKISSDYLFKYFILIDRNYIDIMKSKEKELFKIKVILNIYRFFKFSGFQLLCLFMIQNKSLIILEIKIIGNFSDGDIVMSKFDSIAKFFTLKQINPFFFNQTYFKILNSENSSKIDLGYLLDIKDTPIIFPQNKQLYILWKRYFEMINYLYSFSFKCFGSSGNNIFECLSNKSPSGIVKKAGVWDRPCQDNYECPFYKANKNYENNFGGCQNGYCQMPIGIERIGYHFFTKLYNAFCYNCKEFNNINCCQDQLKNLDKYKGLKSPDYAFFFDSRVPSLNFD